VKRLFNITVLSLIEKKLWIYFNLLSSKEEQITLHNIFRRKITDWEKKELIIAAVLTYHFHTPRHVDDSLYVCLNIPSVKKPYKRSIKLSNEVIEQIPIEIMSFIKKICSQNRIALEIKDYAFLLIQNKASRMYRNAPIEERLRFASIGTKIAIKVLNRDDLTKQPWTSDKKLAAYILSQIEKELGKNYFWVHEAVHFVCNPLLINDNYVWALISRTSNFLRRSIPARANTS